TELPVIFSSFERTDFALFGSFVSNKDDMRIVVNSKTGVSVPRDLKGKRIGLVPESSAQYFLDLFLLYHLIDPSEVELVYFNKPMELPEAFSSGAVDAVAVWEPYGYRTMKLAGREAMVLKMPRLYTQTFNMVGNKQFLSNKPEAAVKLLAVIGQANAWIEKNPESAKNVLRARLSLDQAFVDYMFPTFKFDVGLPNSLLVTMQSQIQWAHDNGHGRDGARAAVNSMPDLLDVIDGSLVNRFRKEKAVGAAP
ncbi:MAG TPA: ABC transporter substrate-binding protein, partial [Limnobacter sp.]|nr:ABC transporter substrate-binding protein [Limnobacter sp.]